MFIYIFLVFFLHWGIFSAFISWATGSWLDVDRYETRALCKDRVEKSQTFHQQPVIILCFYSAMLCGLEHHLCYTSVCLSVFVSVSVYLRSQGHNFYSILMKLGTDLWSIKHENEFNNRFPLSPIFTQNWHLNNAFSIDVLKYFSDINCRPI